MSEPLPPHPPVSRKRQSIVNLICIYFNVVLTIVQGIILTPLYLKYIPASLYGAWLATGNILVWISLVDPGISRIMLQRTAFTYGSREMDKLGGVIGTGLFLGCIFSFLPLIAFPFSGHIAGTLNLSAPEHAELTRSFKWALVSTCIMIANFQPAAANYGLQRTLAAGISYTIATLTGIVITFFMLRNQCGLLSIPAGLTARAVVMLILNATSMLAWCAKNLRGGFSIPLAELRKYTALSTIVFVERLVSVILTQSDTFLAAKWVSNEQAVVYTITGRGFEPVRLFADRLMPAFLPGLAHLSGEGKHDRLMEISRRLQGLVAFVVSVGAACIVALNFAFVKLWVGDALYGGENLTVTVGCFMVTNALFLCLSEIVFSIGGAGPVEVMRVCESVVRIILQLVLLKLIGIAGIPLGGCIGMLLVSGFYLPRLAAKKINGNAKHQYRAVATDLLRSIVLLSCGGGAWIVLSHLKVEWTWTRFCGSSVVVGILFGAIGLALSPSTRTEINHLINRLRRTPGAK